MSDKDSQKEKIIAREIEDEMKESYLDYSMSVIVSRALPDARDGLKPVHRRILYAMYKTAMFHNKPFKKCARIVGEVLGKYHPHGDTAVYDTLVRMAQDFALRYTLIQGQGNFGSIDGDRAAAMRYTECRLHKHAEEMLADIDKNTVKFVPNFDESLKEPTVLPAKMPNLLINGSSGIAVGMATNIPPHNMNEVCAAVKATIENPEISVGELLNHIKGPDFPTGAQIIGKNGISSAYETGRGRIVIRGKTEVIKKDKTHAIIVTEIPYQVNKAMLIEEIANLVKDKKVQGITELRDESDRDGMRIVIELQKSANSEVILNQLYKHSRLQTTFGINMLALVKNQPKTLNLKELLQNFIKHRQTVVRKRIEFDLKKAEERAHILEGLIIALNNIDEVIKKIKASKDINTAQSALMKGYKLTEIQAKAILDMRLQKLASLEQEKIKKEYEELKILIEKLKAILADENKILAIIKKECEQLIENYGDERKTEIVEGEEVEIDIEDMIKKENMIITISHAGYIKRLPINTYKQQKRGGKGIIAATTKEEDFIEDIFVANTHSYLLIFTDKGRVHWLRVYQIPAASRQARGTAIVNLVKIEKDEKITAYVPVSEFTEGSLIMCTKKGTVKKTALTNFSRPRKGGIIAITLVEKDQLIGVVQTTGESNIIVATKDGMAIRFSETNIRDMGRSARGVRGIRLKEKDKVIGMVLADDDKTLLTITENGYGKRTQIPDYRLINRGGKGVKNIICSERNGSVVAVRQVDETNDVLFISQNGIAIRTPVKDISTIGRNTQGVRLMKIEQKDKVVAAAKIIKEEEEEQLAEETPEDATVEEEGKKKKGFFKRLFGG